MGILLSYSLFIGMEYQKMHTSKKERERDQYIQKFKQATVISQKSILNMIRTNKMIIPQHYPVRLVPNRKLYRRYMRYIYILKLTFSHDLYMSTHVYVIHFNIRIHQLNALGRIVI